ncbi:hypothetical protein N0B44_31220 [Roseibacterium beibuensis]|uniref:hypothetical protein n=1 Tax=[Roseibacterium] beibuensis TaxID=1193142 RepID=UPI00217D78D7|nr:hypothetical protein [Roseibacterium beibuensis]MCS6627388.1 hypothetical protein [Roseibacterium beibuensis]
MRDQADAAAGPRARGRGRLAEYAPYALMIGAVWLGWQILLQPVTQRAPPELAVRLAPGSPLVLRRAAEAEFAAGHENDDARRLENAAVLARETLARSPFNVRALRVIGLTEARAGRDVAADEILTLAGNWSLRDDPTHAWLVEYRLRRGDYASAFAHADTLVRRREDIRPTVFRLFTAAATQDAARALPEIAALVDARPSWRQAYLDSLYADVEGLQVAASLAILLQRGDAPLTNQELSQLYMHLLDKGQVEAVRTVRARLNRPPAAPVSNGGFDDADAPQPFQWRLAQEAGAVVEIVADDVRPADPALRIDYDGYSTVRFAEQLLFLTPGRYRFTAEARAEAGEPGQRMAWTVTCSPSDLRVLSTPAVGRSATVWSPISAEFTIPAGCPGQWLRLESRGDDRRASTIAWIDRVAMVKLGSP